MIDIEISVIASGSNGNCCLVEDKNASVLIDAGKSCREIEKRMNNLGKSPEKIDAVLLTHAHIDHCAGADALSRKHNLPIYMNKEMAKDCFVFNGNAKSFNAGKNFKVKNLTIKPIRTSHDLPSCGFVVGKFGLFTDTGRATPEMAAAMKKLKGVLLESNYDFDMLVNGFYPAFLKQRIMSDRGHLSNIDASSFVKKEGNHLDWVLLGHLSANNNHPDIAKKTFETIVGEKTNYSILSRDKESGCWKI